MRALRWTVLFTIIPCLLVAVAYRWFPAPGGLHSAKAASSPVEVAQELHCLHLAGDYAGIGRLLVPDKRAATLELLRAIDEALAATRWLKDSAERMYAGPIVEARALAEMENRLGVFSTHLAILGQSLRGDTATLTLQQGTQIPLVYARFKWHENRWLYEPENTGPALAAEMQSLAAILRETARAVEAGLGIEKFVLAFSNRVGPQMGRIAKAAGEAQSRLAATEPTAD